MTIDRFSGKYRFLSNFYPTHVTLDGLDYSTVEHAYQAAKTFDRDLQRAIIISGSPGQAKRLGRTVILREDWEFVKIPIMYSLVSQKFDAEYLGVRLKATSPEYLVEGNIWGDAFWGVCGGRGENYLGKILMSVRLKLLQGDKP